MKQISTACGNSEGTATAKKKMLCNNSEFRVPNLRRQGHLNPQNQPLMGHLVRKTLLTNIYRLHWFTFSLSINKRHAPE